KKHEQFFVHAAGYPVGLNNLVNQLE
ncbi:MAG: hypothetical protein K0S25_1965, partial [Bacillus sp. (in: firmicutes)]|nr:hypothetical protein [Bacillus sp. (in: firmicutes)]